MSFDADHVLADLRDRFPEIVASLESIPGWTTERVQPPVLILGALDGFLTGIRPLRRSRPLETETVAGLTVPTLAEMARIKGWLLLTRNTVRDYLDLTVLLDRLGADPVAVAFSGFDEMYERGPGGKPPLVELVDRLAAAVPGDKDSTNLGNPLRAFLARRTGQPGASDRLGGRASAR